MTAHCSWAGRPGPTTFPPTTADGARASGRRDRKSTRLNSSHSQISYAVSLDQKSTRLNSSHSQISYAVFCLKKKTQLKSRQLKISHQICYLKKKPDKHNSRSEQSSTVLASLE